MVQALAVAQHDPAGTGETENLKARALHQAYRCFDDGPAASRRELGGCNRRLPQALDCDRN